MLRLIAGLLFPDAGTVTVGKYEAMEREPEMLSDIFFVPEEPYLEEKNIFSAMRPCTRTLMSAVLKRALILLNLT